jgi:hypothetical protein
MLLLVIPCSYRKKWSGQIEKQSFTPEEETKFEDNIGELRAEFLAGRRKYQASFRDEPVPALDRYEGLLYTTQDSLRPSLVSAIRHGWVTLVILSGGYGAVTASERIHWYNQQFDLEHWRAHGLAKSICRFAEALCPEAVLGFFKFPSQAPEYEHIFDDVVLMSGSRAKKYTFPSYAQLSQSLVDIVLDTAQRGTSKSEVLGFGGNLTD